MAQTTPYSDTPIGAQSVTDQGFEVADKIQHIAGSLNSALTNSLKQQPMTTLAVAIAVGFAVGALWKS